MRVTLVHNPSSGRENHTAAELIDEIASAGHQVIEHITRKDDLASALRRACDLVAVAGGDGTIGDVAERLIGTGVPLAMIALGTANNIARTFGVQGTCAEQIDAWSAATVRGVDMAVATVDGEVMRFLEALGIGAFPRVIDQAHERESPVDPVARLARDVDLLSARVEVSPLKPYTITADGEDLSGDYLMVEVCNIPFIGPAISLAPAADPGDGQLDVVLARDADRDHLARAIEGRRTIALTTRRASRISILGEMRRYHRDGDLCEGPARHIEIALERDVLRVLAPSGK